MYSPSLQFPQPETRGLTIPDVKRIPISCRNKRSFFIHRHHFPADHHHHHHHGHRHPPPSDHDHPHLVGDPGFDVVSQDVRDALRGFDLQNKSDCIVIMEDIIDSGLDNVAKLDVSERC